MILVLGYGNPLRGDDGVGQLLAQVLAERNSLAGVCIGAYYQLAPELAEPVSRANVVMFIDACVGSPTGYLACRDIRPLEAGNPPAMTHHASPESLLAAARDLYGACPDAFVVTIAGECFAYGEDLSHAMRAVLPELLDAVEQIIHLEYVLQETGSKNRA